MFNILLIPFLTAMFLAINMGGSGTAPAFSSAYGANLIRKDLIPGLFGLFVFAGAILAGKKVALTVGKGILPGELMTLTLTTIILLSVSLSLFLANVLKVPQSTSQSTVFALVGPALYFDKLQTQKLFFEIIPTWFIMPVAAFIITFTIAKLTYKPIKNSNWINYESLSTHPLLKFFVIGACCYVAFAIGSNNVANASGPIASMISNELEIIVHGDKFLLIMILSTLIIAPCFGIGSSLFGSGVIETTGKEIIDFGPLGAILISAVTASLLLVASLTKGIPTSLVQMSSASIIALGIVKIGHKTILTHRTIQKMLIIWIVAPLIALILSYGLTCIADAFHLL
ncbi:MAG: anion permease [Candidatus Omnitrophica bacterium]|nr:anion permease [Candidatus Omnitrophota bacterium]